MNAAADRLYKLLPVAYRMRDAEQGFPLQMLLRVIEEQVKLVEDNIEQLYDNWFIETCEDWVVPYIGDLIGYRPVHVAAPEDSSSALDKALVPRREVANTIHFRRRKGTLTVLEDLAFAVSGWPAKAVEFDKSVAVTQSLNHIHQMRGRTTDLRSHGSLSSLGTPFDHSSHTFDIRGTSSSRSRGRYGLPEVGVFVWRLKPFSVTHTPAYCLEEAGNHCFTFSILGNDTPLFAKAVPAGFHKQVIDLPTPILREEFDRLEIKDGVEHHCASERFYGAERSLAIWAGKWADLDPKLPVPAERIVSADLSGWSYRPKPGQVAVDTELGRIAFPPSQLPPEGVWTTYNFAFSAAIGGGEYERPPFMPSGGDVKYYYVRPDAFPSISQACRQWAADNSKHGIIEIGDSGVYEEQVRINIGEGKTLELRAAQGTRPTIFLGDRRANQPDPMLISGERGSRFVLDGILVTGRAIEIRQHLDELVIRHCTLVPGWTLHSDCEAHRPGEASLVLASRFGRVDIEHSIVGPIVVQEVDPQVPSEPFKFFARDSILDATRPSLPVISGMGNMVAQLEIDIRRCTVLGQVQAHAVKLAENCIFTGEIGVARRQVGCMRFCFVPKGSRTPKRYHCQPDLVKAAAASLAHRDHLPAEERQALEDEETSRVEPQFLSLRFGQPTYCQLADDCADEINRGASDQSELGAFHDLYRPQREANLRSRLDEYTPADCNAGLFFAT